LQKEQVGDFVSWLLQVCVLLELLTDQVVHDIMQGVISNTLEVFNSLDAFLDEFFHAIMIVVNLFLQLELQTRKFKQNLLVMVGL